MHLKKHIFLVGIDPGTVTGFAEWHKQPRLFTQIESMMIHQAMERLISLQARMQQDLLVRIEDARLRTWFGNTGPEVWKGAGSICRDAKIWEDFLREKRIDFELVAPKNNKTKVTHEYFTRLTGWSKPTNEHSRDAAMLVFGK